MCFGVVVRPVGLLFVVVDALALVGTLALSLLPQMPMTAFSFGLESTHRFGLLAEMFQRLRLAQPLRFRPRPRHRMLPNIRFTHHPLLIFVLFHWSLFLSRQRLSMFLGQYFCVRVGVPLKVY